jgi:phage gpG-like protein
MTVRADTKDLQVLRKLCQGETLKARILRAAAAEGLRQNQLGFRSGTDPDDSPWEPLKSRSGMILIRTARMRNSFTSRATARGFVVGSNVKYVTFHQDGTRGHKAHTQQRFTSSGGKFVSMHNMELMEGRARVTNASGKRTSRKRSVRGIVTMQMKAGGGAIPIRRMVPAGGQLTQKWQTAIDTTCNGVMKKVMAEAGAR